MKYKYLIFDGDYLLTRNFKKCLGVSYYYQDKEVLKDENEISTLIKQFVLTPQDLARSVFYSVSKFLSENHTCEVPIIVFDKTPYYKSLSLDYYKSGRSYVTEENLIGLDPEIDAVKIALLKEEICRLKIKSEAKSFIKEHFPKLGIECLYKKGYEADDLAKLISDELNQNLIKSAIISNDDDWSYLINPKIDYINFKGKVTSYEDKLNYMNYFKNNLGDLSLYQYKSIVDSIYGSHNDLRSTIDKIKVKKVPIETIISKIEHKEYDFITDIKVFENQLKSFSIYDYPEIDEVKQEIKKLISYPHLIIKKESFANFRLLNKFFVSDNYYSNFQNQIDLTQYEQITYDIINN